MDRMNKLAVLEAAFNHHLWVTLESRSGISRLVLVPYSVSVMHVPSFIYFWVAESTSAKPEELEQVVLGIGELDGLERVSLKMDAEDFSAADFDAAYSRFLSSGRLVHMRF